MCSPLAGSASGRPGVSVPLQAEEAESSAGREGWHPRGGDGRVRDEHKE